MKMLNFSSRTVKEIIRDPLNLGFGLGFPIVLILLLTAIQANVPVELFQISKLTPGITVFGFSFMTLFAAQLIAKDRETALLQRLYTTPLSAGDFIFGYVLPILPIALAQSMICYVVAIVLGLQPSIGIVYALMLGLIISAFFIGLGLLCGSVMNSKQVGGLCGALLTNLCAWLSGTWFDLELVGGAFKDIAYLLPFVHAADLERAALKGSYGDIMPHLWWVLGWTAVTIIGAVAAFLRQMRKQ